MVTQLTGSADNISMQANAGGGGSGQITTISALGDYAAPGALAWLKALASVSYEGADPDAAQAWVASHFKDPGCEDTDTHRSECSITIGQAHLTLSWDQRGLQVGGPVSVSLRIERQDSPDLVPDKQGP